MADQNAPVGVDGSTPPAPETFGSALGQAVWLMSMSAAHKELPIGSIEARTLPAILLKQFKLYFKGKQPVAFVAWAMVTDEAKARLDAGEVLALQDWRAGPNLVAVDCVSPFAPPEQVVAEFMASMKGVTEKAEKLKTGEAKAGPG